MGDSCDHGTFTPRVEPDEPGYRVEPGVGISRQSTSAAPSVHGPESVQTGASTPLPVKYNRSL